mgnify:CR=1 FL=1
MWKMWVGLAGMACLTAFTIYSALRDIRRCLHEDYHPDNEKRWSGSTILAVSLLIAALLLGALFFVLHRFAVLLL